MSETLAFLANGFAIAFQWHNLIFAFLGVLIGTAVGILPGIGPSSGMALLIPITATLTSGLPPESAATSAIIMLAGIFYGAMYGGSTTSILINAPGESASVVTALDGYQMAKRGRAGAALSIAAIGSFLAGIFSLIMLILFAMPLAEFAIRFGPAEYFSLVLLGIVAITSLSGKSMTKALMMLVTGLVLSTVGIDVVSGSARFTFRIPALYQGFDFITAAVGMFALGEIFQLISNFGQTEDIIKVDKLLPTKEELKASVKPIARGSLLGFFIGILPGAGPTIILLHFLQHGKEAEQASGALWTRCHRGCCRPGGSEQFRYRRCHDPAVEPRNT